MKHRLTFVLITTMCLLTLFPALAQNATGEGCEPAAINIAIDKLVAAYLGDRLEADDAAGALQAADDLQTAIAEVIAGCADAAAEATADAENVSSGEMDLSALTEGKWMLNWSSDGETCSDGESGTVGINRPIILRTEGDKLITEDIFVWPKLEYSKDLDGKYFYRRNVTMDDGSTLSFEYAVVSMSPALIEGTSTAFFESINCVTENQYQLVLVDENVTCMAGSQSGANLRSGPGTDFDRLGALKAGEPADVIGQATGSDGFVWWQLADESWVRSDLVDEAGDCEQVETVTP
jgi:hypothetical protein